jgi:hypothetical protein
MSTGIVAGPKYEPVWCRLTIRDCNQQPSGEVAGIAPVRAWRRSLNSGRERAIARLDADDEPTPVTLITDIC